MKCINCNSEVAGGLKFCPNCGSPISISMPIVCSKCGAEIKEGEKFCTNCGSQIVFPEQPQQPQQRQYQQPYQEKPQQEQSQPSQIGVVLKFVEYFFYILAAADFLLGTFGIIDITGWKWSPVLFGAIGACIGQYVKQKYGIVDDDEE